ncbi:MAG: hypothetical protein BWY27_01322 [Bacteroidetes bacterium ADurb.Bin234]|nr:MAG: hypothetical protein BWY27_01322 [Bacteroidetes bacterium ADurb.Bin234]
MQKNTITFYGNGAKNCFLFVQLSALYEHLGCKKCFVCIAV